METYFFLLLAFILDEDFFWNKIHFWSLRNVSNYTFGRWGGWRSFQVYERNIINQGAIRIVSYITLTDVGTEKKDEIPSGNVNYSRQLFCGDETMTLSRRNMLTKWKCAVEGYGGFLWVLFLPLRFENKWIHFLWKHFHHVTINQPQRRCKEITNSHNRQSSNHCGHPGVHTTGIPIAALRNKHHHLENPFFSIYFPLTVIHFPHFRSIIPL